MNNLKKKQSREFYFHSFQGIKYQGTSRLSSLQQHYHPMGASVPLTSVPLLPQLPTSYMGKQQKMVQAFGSLPLTREILMEFQPPAMAAVTSRAGNQQREDKCLSSPHHLFVFPVNVKKKDKISKNWGLCCGIEGKALLV